MKVLITGFDGFLGTEIHRRLKGSGWSVVGFSNGPLAGTAAHFYKGSVTDPKALNDVFSREKPHACIHLAGLAHAVVNHGEIEQIKKVNLQGAINTAKAAVAAGVRQFIYFSSAKVYGENTSAKGISEDDSPNPKGIYAEFKYQAELKLAELTRKDGLGVVVVRPTAVFGPGDSRGNYARLIRAVRRGIFPVVGGGRALRSIVYLGRVAERIENILGAGFIPGRTYVFCDGTFSLREILESIRRSTSNAFYPNVPLWLGNTGGIIIDGFMKKILRKESHVRESLSRLTENFVIHTHHYEDDYGQLSPFDLNKAMSDTCSQN
jgi:UDP-glucose 4-epimerase